MDGHAYYEFKILEHLEESPVITHRMAADKLGVSVKLTHSLMRGLIKRGWIHATRKDGRSLYYFLTPQGIAEKVRLTYEFVRFSHQFYKQARRRSSEVCRDLAIAGVRRIAFLGCGDLAEISYLGVSEHGLKLVAVFDDDHAGEAFLGLAIKPSSSLPPGRLAGDDGSTVSRSNDFERVLVTSFDPAFPLKEHYLPPGLEADERFVWVFDHAEMVAKAVKNVPKKQNCKYII